MHCYLTEKTLSFLNRRLFLLLPPLQFCQLKDDTVTSQYSSVLPIALFELHCILFLFLLTLLVVPYDLVSSVPVLPVQCIQHIIPQTSYQCKNNNNSFF
mmetsp:Transcript_26023/g.38710  ORF Transcript_26023/g.38710 Transcript_26023/m.38710 type:complete len:99 (-) Transcript_26023:1082-1378(-)